MKLFLIFMEIGAGLTVGAVAALGFLVLLVNLLKMAGLA